MTAKDKKTVYQIVTEKIMDQLKAGHIPWSKPWRGGIGTRPKNLVSKKYYRGVNTWLLGFSDYDSPYWLTFKQASNLKGKIKKGEKATLVVFFKINKREVEVNGVQQVKKYAMLRYYNVFNLEQCEGIKNPDEGKEKEKVKEFSPIEACEKIVEGFSSKPEIKFLKQQAYYSPRLDYINMPKKDSFKSSEEYYSTLFHELTHSTGHESRLKRQGIMDIQGHFFGDQLYSKEELVAEFGASYLCGIAGIENKTIRNSAAYIQSWLTALKNDEKMVVQACGKAQKAADHILGEDSAEAVDIKEEEKELVTA